MNHFEVLTIKHRVQGRVKILRFFPAVTSLPDDCVPGGICDEVLLCTSIKSAKMSLIKVEKSPWRLKRDTRVVALKKSQRCETGMTMDCVQRSGCIVVMA